MQTADFEEPAMWYCPDGVTTFRWAGGYIDVGISHIEGAKFVALDCINVYGRSEEMTLTTFQRVCNDYLTDAVDKEDPDND